MIMIDFKQRTLGIIRCYFILNPNKWITSREIVDFLENNDFKMGKLHFSAKKIGNIMNEHYFKDIEVKKNNNRKEYKYNV